MTNFEKVKLFMQTYGQEVKAKANFSDEKTNKLRVDLIKEELNNDAWKKILQKNLTDMYKGNSWGVPTFKISNLDGSNPYYQWGQDRIWLIENEIIKRLVNHQ